MTKSTLPVKLHGIVTAVEPASIASRTATLIKTGTNPLIADRIATLAAEQQALRDAGVKAEIALRTRVLQETVASTKLTPTGAPAANAPTAVPVPAFEETTIEKLRAFAAEQGLEIGADLKLKGDIHAAIVAAHAAKFSVA